MRERDVGNRRVTPTRQYLDGRIKSLILDLTAPHAGERLLDIGCGAGENLRLFRQKGCMVSGLDSSQSVLDETREKLENRVELHLGNPEDLPFSDNEFDLVTMIASLEYMKKPVEAIAEAIRVCRGRMFIGTMNPYSLIGIQGKLPNLFPFPSDATPRHFHVHSLSAMIRKCLPGVRIQWGSVVFLPWGWYSFASSLEEQIPVIKNPFGAFVGLSFSVTFSFIAVQDAIRKPAVINGQNPAHVIVGGTSGKDMPAALVGDKNGP
jgi:SAM-dependent methyltransferase